MIKPSQPIQIKLNPLSLCLNRKSSKFIALIIMLLLVNYKSQAQEWQEEYHELVGGLTAGLNFTQVDGDGYKGYNKVGPNFGGILILPFGQMDYFPIPGTLALSLEVLYEQKGSKGMDPVISANLLSQTIDLKYAEVPVLINYYRGPHKTMGGMGFGFSYLGYSQENISTLSGQQYKFPFRKLDISYILSVSLHIWNGFFLNPRFEYSLLNIRKKSADLSNFGRSTQFNNVATIRLMYLFGKNNGE